MEKTSIAKVTPAPIEIVIPIGILINAVQNKDHIRDRMPFVASKSGSISNPIKEQIKTHHEVKYRPAAIERIITTVG